MTYIYNYLYTLLIIIIITTILIIKDTSLIQHVFASACCVHVYLVDRL